MHRKGAHVRPLSQFNQPISLVFTDIDDTLTTDGRLESEAYNQLWRLHQAGIKVIPVTGRPAGWCEMIARFWPVFAVIGENGAFYFQYKNKKMNRHFAQAEDQRKKNQSQLEVIQSEVLTQVPGAQLASDQFCRLFDLAIDFCEDVPPLDPTDVERIVAIFEKYGATAKVSSIHVNGWFGDYDKKTMCEIFYRNEFHQELSQNLSQCAFIGDSPNDEPLFAFFENSFAVANIKNFLNQLEHPPAYLCPSPGGSGFKEFCDQLLVSNTPK
jgi:HAD superfamily hydrolase (TIGR01484 family)